MDVGPTPAQIAVSAVVTALSVAIVPLAVRRRLCLVTYSVALVGNAAIVALWILTRTVGTLIGPEPTTAEPIGLAASLATALELTIVVGGAWLTRRARLRPALSRDSGRWCGSGVVQPAIRQQLLERAHGHVVCFATDASANTRTARFTITVKFRR